MLYLDLGVVLTTGNIFLYIVYRIFLEAKKDVAVSTEQAMYLYICSVLYILQLYVEKCSRVKGL